MLGVIVKQAPYALLREYGDAAQITLVSILGAMVELGNDVHRPLI
jgi:hypothetical protein